MSQVVVTNITPKTIRMVLIRRLYDTFSIFLRYKYVKKITNSGSVCEMGSTNESSSALSAKEIDPAPNAPKIPAFQNNRISFLKERELRAFEKTHNRTKKRKEVVYPMLALSTGSS